MIDITDTNEYLYILFSTLLIVTFLLILWMIVLYSSQDTNETLIYNIIENIANNSSISVI